MADNSDPSITITLTDIYLKLCNLEDRVQEMTPQGQAIADHEDRIRSIERWKYALPSSLMLSIVSIVAMFLEVKR